MQFAKMQVGNLQVSVQVTHNINNNQISIAPYGRNFRGTVC